MIILESRPRTACKKGINRGERTKWAVFYCESRVGVDIEGSGQVRGGKLWAKGIGKEYVKKLLWILKWMSYFL